MSTTEIIRNKEREFWNSLSDDAKKDYIILFSRFGFFSTTIETITEEQISEIYRLAKTIR